VLNSKENMKSKTITTLTLIAVIVALGFIFKIYMYDSARDSYCVTQTRQQFPEEKGSPSEEWFEYYDECLNNLSVVQVFTLVFSSPQTTE